MSRINNLLEDSFSVIDPEIRQVVYTASKQLADIYDKISKGQEFNMGKFSDIIDSLKEVKDSLEK